MSSSTPAYLNPPSFPFSLENLIADQAAQDHQRLKLFISSSVPYGAVSSSLSFPAFFDSFHDQSRLSSTTITVGHQALLYNQMANKGVWQGEASYDHQVISSSSLAHPILHVSGVSNEEYHKSSVCTDQIAVTNEDHDGNTNRPVKWTPSMMKLMQKITHESDQVHEKISITYNKFQSACRDDQNRETNTGETTTSRSGLTASISKSRIEAAAVRVCSDCGTSTTPL